MIFDDLLKHFNIQEEFPQYLLNQRLNEVFLDGELFKIDKNYKIVVKTRQNVTHQLIIKPNDEYPLTVLSKLSNGSLNGMKFGISDGDVTYINKL
ncbi:hypothetical protein [Methanobrevibacter sp.]|uniref:hypothetical protein n=1 Tax=Methanobrevibacter sp. TaxID=66852 RepID=UPI0026E028FD|nr:hypothetical protein [Methanobrevibacter sp.]MDO5823940.1 hypothetical protein [Methanobrevibacter sp.]